jgi:alkylated DNA repair protein alkB family protein 6
MLTADTSREKESWCTPLKLLLMAQAHEDGPAYHSIVATVSLGSHISLSLTPKSNRALQMRILQEPGSLLITHGSVYTDYLHGIEEVEIDENLSEETVANWNLLSDPEHWRGDHRRSTRTSLTFRDVLKVIRIGI